MRKISLLIFFTIVAFQAVFSQEKTAVDYRAQYTKLIKMGDSSVVKLIGNVYLYHNGAVISCDSAYRYSERRFEALGSVIINQESVYIYGDKVLYNGETEQAEVFSDLIKIVDSTAVMYTRDLNYNTASKILHFYGGATLSQNNSLVEAEEGFYNSETKIFDLKKRVAMENEDYILKTNNLQYVQNLENIFFYSLTNIWSKKGEYLQADKGKYEKEPQIYNFEKNSYILTKEQECWADSLIYYSSRNEVELKRNIQLLDTTQNVVSFGDYGFFWSDSKNVLLTRNPSLFSYDESGADTTFVRADTITIKPIIERSKIGEFLAHRDSLKIAGDTTTKYIKELEIGDKLVDTLSRGIDTQDMDMLKKAQQEQGKAIVKDNIELNDKDKRQKKREEIKELKDMIDEGIVPVDSTGVISDEDKYSYKPAFTQKQLDEMSESDRKEAERIMKKDLRTHERRVRQMKRQEMLLHIIENEKAVADSIEKSKLPKKEPVEDIQQIMDIKNQPDTSDYIIRGFGNAKIYKKDIQSVADTLIVETVDSTQTSIGTPYAWNGLNQIQARRIRTYTLNGQIYRTRMFDNPILSQEVKPEKYNQMGGSYMDALYRDNEIYRLIINKDSQTRFYREEKVPDTKDEMEPVVFITSTSDNMIIDMDSSQVVRIKWIGATETFTYPIEEEPKDKLYLEGFKWVPELRPTREDVFNRTIKPSVRKAREAINKPSFNITKAIMQERKDLLKSGKWVDRNDKLKIDVNELFRQSKEQHE